MKKILIFLLTTTSTLSFSQVSKRVLFIGNSYTSVNNLPQLVHDLSLSAGDSLIFDSNTPGGQTLEGHFTNTTTTSKIAQGNWDFVVLQEQSQRPSFSDAQVEVEVFPFAQKLDSLIHASNSCTETIFYMTWGRKNGDASNCQFWPPVCTYQGMDSVLYHNYMKMGQDNQALVSPVGKLWHYLRTNYPNIELYASDESHPSLSGSYAAACAFYTTIFRKNPNLILNDYGLNPSDASIIRNAAKLIVYDSLSDWFVGNYDPQANFSYQVNGNNSVQFNNESNSATSYSWSFGDNYFSSDPNPTHSYSSTGNFQVQLIAENNCDLIDTLSMNVVVQQASLELLKNEVNIIFPNPVQDEFLIQVDAPQKVVISSLQGEILNSFSINTTTKINFSEYKPGMYFIQLQNEANFIKRIQIIKE